MSAPLDYDASPNCDGRRARATAVRLGQHDLVVVLAKVQAVALPRVEVVANGDRAARALVLADADVLPERRRAALD
jgi:hypothetical protein